MSTLQHHHPHLGRAASTAFRRLPIRYRRNIGAVAATSFVLLLVLLVR